MFAARKVTDDREKLWKVGGCVQIIPFPVQQCSQHCVHINPFHVWELRKLMKWYGGEVSPCVRDGQKITIRNGTHSSEIRGLRST